MKHRNYSIRRRTRKRGCGLLNTLMNKLPVELHIMGYQYCGPDTNLEQRFSRNDLGINLLDKRYIGDQSLEAAASRITKTFV